jgi:hypothetical protein
MEDLMETLVAVYPTYQQAEAMKDRLIERAIRVIRST